MSEDRPEDFYNAVYGQDNPPGEAHGWIQWKGTNACIDLHCKCGHHGHHDGMFLYFYECPECGRVYALGQNVKLIELDDVQATYARHSGSGAKGDAASST